jgi:CRP/FNR family transcriptional regulator, cyclic AMP receptor protein
VQKQSNLFAPIHGDPHKFLAQISAGRLTSDFKKDSDIFVEGAASVCVLYIQSGQVQVTITSEQGRQATVAILEAGQFFGEDCLSGQVSRITSAKALTDCRITTIDKASMWEALAEQPLFAKFFVVKLLRKNLRIEGDLIDMHFNSSEKRLARLLLILANYGKEGSPPIAPISLRQETLAEMVGTTRSRVSAFMNKFRDLGLIDYDSQINVHHSMVDFAGRVKAGSLSPCEEVGDLKASQPVRGIDAL